MKFDKKWYEIGDWFNNHKHQIIAFTISLLVASMYITWFQDFLNKPIYVTYREYINDLEAGMDVFDENGNLVIKVEDKIDTVYFDTSHEEWKYSLWTNGSRKAYEKWIADGNDSADFKYDYKPHNYRTLKVYSTSYDKMKEHIEKYDGIACRTMVKYSSQPFYADLLPAIGSMALMFTFMLGFMGLYAKKMSNMGGISKNLLVKDTGVRFSDVIGHDEIIDDLKLIVGLMKKAHDNKLKNENKLKEKLTDDKTSNKFNANIPRGMLFSGEAGTGKTMLAKAIAGEAGVPFLYMNASGFVEMYVGVGAKRVRDLFKMARKHSPCIIFIDEIDAVGTDRNAAISSEQKQTINALLQEMDGFDTQAGIFIIAATNNADSLDKALVRSGRFDRQVVISPPHSYKDRIKLFEKYLTNDSYNANLETISRQCVGFTGADINAICNEARLIALATDADVIDDNILEEAIDRKIFKGNRVKSDKKARGEELKIVAHHEAGHALVSVLLGVPIARATIIGTTGGVGGAVFNADEIKKFTSKKDALNQIMIAFGGRAAEEIIFGKENITTGASNDLQQATAIFKQYVTDYGFDDNMAALSVLYEQKLYSKYVVDRVKELSNIYFEKTLNLLEENKNKLTLLAEALMDKETMSGEEISKLLAQVRKNE